MKRDLEELQRTKKAASAVGATRYFTGKPCKNGHVAPRRVSNGGCIGCEPLPHGHNYVYVIFADGIPAYVGKGQGDRVFHSLGQRPELVGKDVVVRIVWASSAHVAFDLEAQLINDYTREGHSLLNKQMPVPF